MQSKLIALESYNIKQGWPNFLTQRPNSWLPGHWRAGCSAIYVTSSSQCCCTAVHSRKHGAWSKCGSYLAGRIKLVGGPDPARGPQFGDPWYKTKTWQRESKLCSPQSRLKEKRVGKTPAELTLAFPINDQYLIAFKWPNLLWLQFIYVQNSMSFLRGCNVAFPPKKTKKLKTKTAFLLN